MSTRQIQSGTEFLIHIFFELKIRCRIELLQANPRIEKYADSKDAQHIIFVPRRLTLAGLVENNLNVHHVFQNILFLR